MADDRWYEILESSIFTLVTHRANKALADKIQKTIKFTTEAQSDSSPYFPTCLIHELSQAESGKTLDGKSINAILETIEVIVYTNSKEECKLITNEITYQLKRLAFDAISMPIITKDASVCSGVCRFRRVVGADDSIVTS